MTSEELKEIGAMVKLRQQLDQDAPEAIAFKHDPYCDCGICQYCGGNEDKFGNPTPTDSINDKQAIDAAKKNICDTCGEAYFVNRNYDKHDCNKTKREAISQAWKDSIFAKTPFERDRRRKNTVREIYEIGAEAGYNARDAEAQAIFDAERKRLKAQMALITRLETKMAEIQDQRNSKTVSTREKTK